MAIYTDYRIIICLVFVISQKFNFYFLPQTSLIKVSVQGSLQSQKNAECSNCCVQHGSIIPPWTSSTFTLPVMKMSQSFLGSLAAEQNRHCAILQGSSKKKKIHRLSYGLVMVTYMTQLWLDTWFRFLWDYSWR